MYKLVLIRHGESDLEQGKPLHRLDRRRPDRKGPPGGRARPASCSRTQATCSTSPTPRCSSAPSARCGSRWTRWTRCGSRWTTRWRLNERHYGALQGLNKAETAAKYGEAQVKIWRRSYDIPPPALTPDDPRFPGKDPRYAGLTEGELPLTECLKDTVARFLPLWHETIAPDVKAGKRVVIAAHGNSLRALVKYLDNISEADIVELNIPTGHAPGLRTGRRFEAHQVLLSRRS